MTRRPAKRKPAPKGWRARFDYTVGVLIGLLLVASLFLVAG